MVSTLCVTLSKHSRSRCPPLPSSRHCCRDQRRLVDRPIAAHSKPSTQNLQNHPKVLPKQLTPPNAALIPVNSTSGPYSLAYNPLPPTSPARTNASLTG